MYGDDTVSYLMYTALWIAEVFEVLGDPKLLQKETFPACTSFNSLTLFSSKILFIHMCDKKLAFITLDFLGTGKPHPYCLIAAICFFMVKRGKG